MAIRVEEYVREDASIPYKQWFDGMGEYVIDCIDKAKELLAEYKARKKAMGSKTSSKHKG